MKKNFFSQAIFYVLVSFALLIVNTCSFALPFVIVHKAGTTPPTSVVPGEPVTAYYTVTNNTGTPRANNYVKYLPLNVVQVTGGGTFANTCGSTFNLAPRGQVGDNCTLQLSVVGGVSPGSDPHQQLFVCFPGGVTCAGTNEPLNVQQLPPALVSITISEPNPSVHVGQNMQLTAIGSYSDGSSQNLSSTVNWVSGTPATATVSTMGVATGVAIGTTAISANFNGINSNTLSLNVVLLAYISNTTSGNVSLCNVLASGAFTTPCTPAGTGFSTPIAIVFNSNISTAFIATQGNNAISTCNTNPATGAFVTPCTINTDPTFAGPTGVAINNVSNVAYVTDFASGQISICPLNGNLFTPCFTSIAAFSQPTNIAINAQGTFAYITTPSSGAVNYCTIDSVSEDFDSCVAALQGFAAPKGIAINTPGTFLYVADATNGVVLCPLNSGAILATCTTTVSIGTIPSPSAITINPAGTQAYVTSTNNNDTYHCTINPANGSLSACAIAATGFNNPNGIAVN